MVNGYAVEKTMVELDELRMAQLARELVMNIRNYKQVFADYGIDETDYYELEKNEFFRKVKDQYTIEWNSATSTDDRLRIGSLAYLEKLFPALTRRALDVNEALPAATGVANLLMRTAGIGVDNKAGDKPASERFVITINLGADTETYNKSIEVNANDISPAISKGEPDGKTTEEVPKRKVGRPKKETPVG